MVELGKASLPFCIGFKMTDKEGIEAIQKQLQQIDELKLVWEMASSEKFVRWREATKRQLKKIFGEESKQFKTFNSIYYFPLSVTTNEVKQRQIERDTYLRSLNNTSIKLQVMIDELNERIQEQEINLTKKAVSDDNKQLEIEVLDIKLNGLLTELKTEIASLIVLKERNAKTNQYNADLSLYHAINDKEQKIEEIEEEISKVKARIAELHKSDELSENELKVLLTMKSEKGRNPRTPRGIRTDTGLSSKIVEKTLSDLEKKELIAEDENRRWYLTDKGR